MSLGLLGEYDTDSNISDSDDDHAGASGDTPRRAEAPTRKQDDSKVAMALKVDDTSAGYDPFGINSEHDTLADDTSSSDSESDKSIPSSPPHPLNPLPLPDLLRVDTVDSDPTVEKSSYSHSSVFSNPYKEAEEERMSILKHHVKELAPEEKKERNKRHSRRGKNRGKYSSIPPPSDTHQSPTAPVYCSSQSQGSHPPVPRPWREAAPSGERADSRTGVGFNAGVLSDELFDENDRHRDSEAQGKRKHRSGVSDGLVPPKKFMKVHSKIQSQERPWSAHQ